MCIRDRSSVANNNPRWRTDAILYFWRNLNNSVAIARICTKFDIEVQNGVSEALFHQIWLPTKSKMAADAILKFRVNGHNSAAIARICTKFDVEMQNGDRKHFWRQNLHPTKSKMAAAAILKFWRNLNNSAAIAHICTKFDIGVRNGVPEALLPSDLTSDKIQDGGGRRFEISR